MRSTPLLVAVGLVTMIFAAGVHVIAFRWLASTFALGTRVRRALALVIALLCVLPLLRALPTGHVAFVRRATAYATLWHVTLATSVILGGILLALVRAIRARAPRPRASDEETPPPPDPARRDALVRIVGLGAFATSAGAFGWGAAIGRTEWRIDEVVIRIPKLPRALDGYTIVQVSDIHVGLFVGESELRRGLSLVAKARPDLIAITGDVVDFDPSFVPLAARMLGDLRARDGIVAIPGNHDHYAGLDAVTRGLARAGVDVLLNRGKLVAEGKIALLGLDDLSGRRDRTRLGPDLARARGMVPPDLPTVLLAHQPSFFDEAIRGGPIDLQLSGHTHGGQINPGFVPARAVMRYVAGLYREGDSQLYVNRGFGTVGPPCRIAAPPEISRIVLVGA